MVSVVFVSSRSEKVVRVKTYEQALGGDGKLKEERKRREMFETTRSILELSGFAI